MNEQLGDFAPGKTIRRSWPSTNGIGAMASLAGTPALAVLRDGALKITAGVTLVADVDYGDGATVGLNRFAIDTSADAAYAAGHDYSVIFIAGTLSGVSLVGQPIATFSLANRSAAQPGDIPTAVQNRQEMDSNSTKLAHLDADVSTRLPTSSYTAPLNAAGTRSALGLGTANLDTQLAAIAALIPTGDENAAALLDLADALETGLTMRQAMRLIVAAEAGKTSGGAGATFTIRDLADTKDRLVATVTADGDRTAIVRDLS